MSFDPERREPLKLSVVTGGARVVGELWPSAPAAHAASAALTEHRGGAPRRRAVRCTRSTGESGATSADGRLVGSVRASDAVSGGYRVRNEREEIKVMAETLRRRS